MEAIDTSSVSITTTDENGNEVELSEEAYQKAIEDYKNGVLQTYIEDVEARIAELNAMVLM